MAVLAQHGFGDGTPGRIDAGLNAGVIQGCILSPKDLSLASLKLKITGIQSDHPSAKILFDPQYYAALVGHVDQARLGSLASDYAGYFSPKHYRDLRREKSIRNEVEKVIQFQQEIALDDIVLPGIVMRDGLASESSSIAKSLLEIGDEIANEKAISSQCWLTLALGESCFRDMKALQDLVDEITGMLLQSHGIYLLVETTPLGGTSPWCNASVLSGQMYLVYALSLAGFRVTCGFSGLSAPYLSAVGAENIAFGWFETLRFFSLDRFMPAVGMGKRPKKKYLSRALWSRIDLGQLRPLASAYPDVMNQSPYDALFLTGDPAERDEIVQHWHAVGEFCMQLDRCESVPVKLADLRLNLTRSQQLKARMPTLSLPGFEERIAQTRAALRRFEELAELSLPEED